MTTFNAEEQAVGVIDLACSGRFDEIRQQFAPILRRLVSTRSLRDAWEAEVARHGALRTVSEPVVEAARAGVVSARVGLGFERGQITLVISMRHGRLLGIRTIEGDAAVPSHWQPPAYGDSEAFVEQEHTIGAGSEAVPATLTLPRGDGPWPAVVLLAGSGPQDRDETIGPNKPFKDLAWGLADHGVAVVRFDKITFVNPEHLRAADDVTIAEEYMPQALAAIRLLLDHPQVAADRVAVIGHSLGGTVAPRVAAREPNVAGMVLLAAGAQPLHWAIVRQLRHLAALSPGVGSTEMIRVATEQAQLIDSPELTIRTPLSELPFGVPASYWLDLRAYDPVATAATLDIPILILQGARD